MKYGMDLHNRHSIRLKGYDYSLEGLYFITMMMSYKTIELSFEKFIIILFEKSDYQHIYASDNEGKA